MVILCCSALYYFCVRNQGSYKFLNWTIPSMCDLPPFHLKNLPLGIKASDVWITEPAFHGVFIIVLISLVIHTVYFIFIAHIFTSLFSIGFSHFCNSYLGKVRFAKCSLLKSHSLNITSGFSVIILDCVF